MNEYEAKAEGHSGSTFKAFNAVVVHVCPTLRARRFLPSASLKPLPVGPAMRCGLCLANRQTSLLRNG
jgi:hypothetical protein